MKHLSIVVWTFISFAALCQRIMSGDLRFSSTGTDQIDFDFHLQVDPGTGYFIEASPNLKNWSAFYTSIADSRDIALRDSEIQPRDARYFRATQLADPLNDYFNNRLILTGRNAAARTFIINGTKEPGEPDHAYFETGHQSLWWTWTAPDDGEATLATVGSLFDTLLAVYTGNSITNLVPISKTRYDSKQLVFRAHRNTVYQIAVDSTGDSYGLVNLTLSLNSITFAQSPSSPAGARIFLTETSDPNVPLRILRISDDTLAWSETYNGETQPANSGVVQLFTNSGSTAALTLNSQVNGEPHQAVYQFDFETVDSGTYNYTLDGLPFGSGTFTDFRDARLGLAPPSFLRRILTLTRQNTTTGEAGQTHFFTFTLGNRFADSDNLENAFGSFQYQAAGSTAAIDLHYLGPASFLNDGYHLELHFTTTTTGTCRATYTKNDGTIIEVDSDFVLEYDT